MKPKQKVFTQVPSGSAYGFSLIELLLAIAIIALLASIILVAIDKSRAKSRDSDGKAAITQVRRALDFYYHNNSAYPVKTSATGFNNAALNTSLDPYINHLPTD